MLTDYYDLIQLDPSQHIAKLKDKVEGEGMPNPRQIEKDIQALIDRKNNILKDIPETPVRTILESN